MGSRLGFEIDRSRSLSLIQQVVLGIRTAIADGHLSPGTKLPTIKEIATELGVSILVVRNAVKCLAEAGEVSARRKIGIEILETGAIRWNFNILYLNRSGSFYFHVRDRAFYERCFDAGIRVTTIPLDEREFQNGLPRIRTTLNTQVINLAVIDGTSMGLLSEISSRRIPIVHLGDRNPPSTAWGVLESDCDATYREMVRHIKACGVRKVCLVYGTQPEGTQELEALIASSGLQCEVAFGSKDPNGACDPYEYAGWVAVKQMLQRPLPDLVYFSNEFLAKGGQAALMESGTRVPEDLQVISYSNFGARPLFAKPVTCIEADPAEHGRVAAELVIAALHSKRPLKKPYTIGNRLILGETTFLGR